MTSCEHARSLIDRYVLDDVPPVERGLLREHLADCRACTAEFAAFSRLLDELAMLPDVTQSPGLDRRIYEAAIADRRVRSSEHGLPALWHQIWRGAMRTTGTLMVTIVVVALLSVAFVQAASGLFNGPLQSVGLVPRATPTPAAAMQATPTPGPTRLAVQPTPAPTAKPTHASHAVVATPTASPTPTPSPSATPTASPTPTPSPSATPTASPTPTRSASPTPTPSPSPTPNPRRCPPGTACYSPSPTPSAASTSSP